MKKLKGLLLLLIVFFTPIAGQRVDVPLDNPNPTRYMVGGNAFQLNGGEFLYKNTMLVVNSITYGFTDYLSLGVGTDLSKTFRSDYYDRWPNLYFVNAKAGFHLVKNLHVAAGFESVLFRDPILGDDSNDGISSISLGYGLLTYGSVNTNVTLGVYLPVVDMSRMDYVPIYNLGGSIRIGRKVSVIAECWTPSIEFVMIDGGFRFFGKRSAFDLGVLYVYGFSFPLPILDYTFKF
jgi:hypothetical protein